MNIHGSPAIIAGGASGLGMATARELAIRGATVGVLDRDQDALGRVKVELSCAVGSADIADDRQTETVINKLVDELGGLRILTIFCGCRRTIDLGQLNRRK